MSCESVTLSSRSGNSVIKKDINEIDNDLRNLYETSANRAGMELTPAFLNLIPDIVNKTKASQKDLPKFGKNQTHSLRLIPTT